MSDKSCAAAVVTSTTAVSLATAASIPDRRRMRRIDPIHFVGIGGSGMSGIAEVLMNLGYKVQGSDLKQNAVTQRLANLGAKIGIGHPAENVDGADVVVISSAVAVEPGSRGRPASVAFRWCRAPRCSAS